MSILRASYAEARRLVIRRLSCERHRMVGLTFLLATSAGCAAGCASAQGSNFERELRAVQSRLAQLEARNDEMVDRVYVLTAQVDECRGDDGASVQLARSSTSSDADVRHEQPPWTSQRLASSENVAGDPAGDSFEDPVELRIHGDAEPPQAMDVTDRPPPHDPVASSEQASLRYEQGLTAFRQGDFAKARESFESFVDRYPGEDRVARALFWIGECSFELEDYRDAVTAYRRIVNEFPASRKVPDAMFKIGSAYEKLQNQRGARRAFEQLVKQHPNSAYSELARARLR